MATSSANSFIPRILFSALVAAALFPAVRASYKLYRADRTAAQDPTEAGLGRALEHDPLDSTLWWRRGRVRLYGPAAAGIGAAIADFRQALSLNPRLGQAWIDLADSYEQIRDFRLADDALARAAALRPFSALTHWQIGNHYLRRGNRESTYRHFRRAVELDRSRLEIALQTVRKLGAEDAHALGLIPDDAEGDFAGLSFFMRRGEMDLAAAVWRRIAGRRMPRGSFNTTLALSYVDRLLVHRRTREAVLVWQQALDLAGISSGPVDSDHSVWNGSFERDLLEGGFDWRLEDTPAARIRLVSGDAREGRRCLEIEFGGENISFAHVSHIVPLSGAGDYELEFEARTSGLTSDQRPYVSISGFPAAGGASARTEPFPAASPWRRVRLPFTAAPECMAVQIRVRRDRSFKLDNRLRGMLQLDDFVLRPAAGPPAAVGRIQNP